MKVLIFLLLLVVNTFCLKGNTPVFTQVTSLYNIGRGQIKGQRKFNRYLSSFQNLLASQTNLIVFGDRQTEEFVWNRRKPHNTIFIYKELQELKKYWFYSHIERIVRLNQVNRTATNFKQLQFKIPYYNVIMFAKLYLVNEALQHDKFNTDMVMWIDAGIFSHVIPRQYSNPRQQFIPKIFEFVQPQWIFFTIYRIKTVGFPNNSKYLAQPIGERTSGGFQGGYVQVVKDLKHTFQNFLRITLQNGDMDSDEIIFDMMPAKYPYLIPATTNRHYRQLYKKYQINPSVSRKPQIVRQFRGRFEEQSKLIIFKDIQYEDHSSRSSFLFELNREVELLTKENDLYRSVLYRQILFFSSLLFLFILLLCNNNESQIKVISKSKVYSKLQQIEDN